MAEVTLEPIGTADHPVADIIFVHGMGGDARTTWMADKDNGGTFWPRWVHEELRDASTPCAVWSLDYAADPSRWFGKGGSMELPLRANGVLQHLTSVGIGQRPVVFIGHSLGGLLIKYLLQSGSESADARARELAERTLGVVFMATPHRGAALASLTRGLRIALPTATIHDLSADSAYLEQVDQWYRNNVDRLGIRTFALRERRKMLEKVLGIPAWPFWVVDPTSADPNIIARPVIDIDADHFQICKPATRDATVYINVRAFLRQVLADEQAMPRAAAADRRRFLGGIARDEKTVCVLSSFNNSVTRYRTVADKEAVFNGPTVSPEDTSAAVYLCSLATRVRSFDNLEVRVSGDVKDEDLDRHQLLVGSSLTNRATKRALAWDDAAYRFTLPEDGEFAIECRRCQENGAIRKWRPNDGDAAVDAKYQAGKATGIDYAIVQRLKRKNLDVFILAGLGPVGSKGAAYFLYQSWFDLYRVYGDRPFGLVLRFGGKGVQASFNDPTVVHRTDPDDPAKCATMARLTPVKGATHPA